MLNNESFVEQFFGKNRIGDKSLGYIQKAEGGTILLNEICDMPYNIQSKFTDFLQKESYLVRGDKDKINSDIRHCFFKHILINFTFAIKFNFLCDRHPLSISKLRPREHFSEIINTN